MSLDLISEVTLRIKPLDRTNTKRDGLARVRALKPKYLDVIEVEAQLDFRTHNSRLADGMSGANIADNAEITIVRVTATSTSTRRSRQDTGTTGPASG
jgi:hypothetical protein